MSDEIHCYISPLRDPWRNLAVEEHLLGRVDAGEGPPCLVFYVNPVCVVVGKNNDLDEWVHLDRVEQSRVPLLRRKSGGGTVVHHEDNLNFGMAFPLEMVGESAPKPVQTELLGIVTDALNQLGVKAEIARICDIVVQDRKVGGNGLWMSARSVLEHGTLLFKARSVLMKHLLPVPPDRDESIGHESFVAGLHELDFDLMMEDFIAELAWAVERAFEAEVVFREVGNDLIKAAEPELEQLRERSTYEN